MSSWELPDGYGRVKPDVLTYGAHVHGLSLTGGCRALSGTSVACPVVAGAVALLASMLPEERRWKVLNPASIKQLLTSSATRLPGRSAYEQGAGSLDLLAAAQALGEYTPHASVLPPEIDLSGCAPEGGDGRAPAGGAAGSSGYMWPHCAQPLYAGALPLLLNLTVLNGAALVSRSPPRNHLIVAAASPPCEPRRNRPAEPARPPPPHRFSTPPRFSAASADDAGRLRLTFEHPPTLWPWGGALGVAVEVDEASETFDGIVRGEIRFELEAVGEAASESAAGERRPFARSSVAVPISVRISPPPPRSRRLLFDQSHSLRYPPAYVPRDNLAVTDELLDWQVHNLTEHDCLLT